MFYARDLRTGNVVIASKASRHVEYLCPVCNGEVYLRFGAIKTPHFAHFSDSVDKDCELYVPGPGEIRTSLGRGSSEAQTPLGSPKKINPLSVGIQIEGQDVKQLQRPLKWGLRVTVPKADTSAGTVEVDLGEDQNRKIALVKLYESAQTYPANPNAEVFKAVSCSPEASHNFRSAVLAPQAGLSKNHATVFQGTARKFKTKVKAIDPGEAYYFVWNKNSVVKIPSSLEQIFLYPDENWFCSLINIPVFLDNETKSWLEDFSKIRVKSSHRICSLFWPFDYQRTPSNELEVFGSESILIGLGDPSKPEDTESIIEAEAGKHIVLQKFDPSSTRLFKIGLDQDSLSALSWDKAKIALIKPAIRGHKITLPYVEFSFQIDGDYQEISLQSDQIELSLRKVREGTGLLSSVAFPCAAQGNVRWRQHTAVGWKSFKAQIGQEFVVEYGQWARLDEKTVSFLNELLRNPDYDFHIDFQGLGERFIPSYQSEGLSPFSDVDLKKQTREKMLWALKYSAICAGRGKPVSNSLSDQDLIERFLNHQPPRELEAHFVEIHRQLDGHSR